MDLLEACCITQPECGKDMGKDGTPGSVCPLPEGARDQGHFQAGHSLCLKKVEGRGPGGGQAGARGAFSGGEGGGRGHAHAFHNFYG